jgi:hypothetical protein
MRRALIAAALLLPIAAGAQTNNTNNGGRSWNQQQGAGSAASMSAASATTGSSGASASTGNSTTYAAPGMAGAPAYSCAMSYSVSALFVGFTWSSPREFCETVLLVQNLAAHGNDPELGRILRGTDVYRRVTRDWAPVATQFNSGN